MCGHRALEDNTRRDLIGSLTAVAAEHDRVWQVRRRVLHTLPVTLSAYRLMLFSGEQGYATTLAELREQCRTLGVALLQPNPVAPSAMCRARAKVDENVFRSVHAEILKRVSCPPAWRGHRLFAIDGSRFNLLRPRIRCRYRTPADTSHDPQGLLSCLVQLPERTPVAFDPCAHGNERTAALDPLPALSPGDVVIYDRGYFSWALLGVHLERDMHPVCRWLGPQSVAAPLRCLRWGSSSDCLQRCRITGRGTERLNAGRALPPWVSTMWGWEQDASGPRWISL